MSFKAPVAYQTDADGNRQIVESRYVLNPNGTVGFVVAPYDTSRELVIDRVMALESEEIDLDQLKWVVLMVLFNQPGSEAAFAWMEDLVLDEVVGQLH